MTGIKEKNWQLSEFEVQWLVCEVCGKQAKTAGGIKRHKAMKDCWGKPADSKVIRTYTVKLDNAPDTTETTIIPKQEAKVEVIKESADAPLIEEDFLPPSDPIAPSTPSPSTPAPEVDEEPKEPLYLNPTKLGLTEIPVGTQLAVLGNVFQPAADGSYNQVNLTEPTPSIVLKRWVDGHQNPYLDTQNESNGMMYVIAEPQVMPPGGTEPQIKIMRIGPAKEPSSISPPAPEVDTAVHDAFTEALDSYILARNEKSEATNSYSAIDEETRPVILDYLQTFGEPSKEGAKDSTLVARDHKVQYTYNEVPDSLDRDDETIIAKCVEKGWLHAIEPIYQIKEDVWEALKLSGNVPDDFLAKVEVVISNKPKRSLLVTKIDAK